jgi:hypothetical protein
VVVPVGGVGAHRRAHNAACKWVKGQDRVLVGAQRATQRLQVTVSKVTWAAQLSTTTMDTAGPAESRTRPTASRRRRRSVCCSSPAVRQRDHTHQPTRPRRPDEVGAGPRPIIDGSEMLVPSASDEDDTYHTADEDFEDAEERYALPTCAPVRLQLTAARWHSASTEYRGFTFRGPVPPSVSPQREDKPFGSTDMEWPLVAEMQQRLQDDGVRCRFSFCLRSFVQAR